MSLPPILTHDQRIAIAMVAMADDLAGIIGRLLIVGDHVVDDVLKL